MAAVLIVLLSLCKLAYLEGGKGWLDIGIVAVMFGWFMQSVLCYSRKEANIRQFV